MKTHQLESSPLSRRGAQSKETLGKILALADVQINGERPSDIQVYDDRFYSRVLTDGSMGFGESYMAGWWDSACLDECICKIIRADLKNQVKPSFEILWNVVRAKLMNMQDKAKSSKVVDEHYEIGNDLYGMMLGETMAYTCAYWNNASNLDEAQRAKYDLIAKKMGLEKGMRVLDLGCGWGGFSYHIAKNYGTDVVAVNLSTVQCAYAKKICQGLSVEVRNHDYRDLQAEPFDRIISIGMMEHVGYKNYREFMKLVHRFLKADGLALVHTIGRNTTGFATDPWINRYIFPHGHLPSIAQMSRAMEKLFVMEDWHNLSVNYDTTLLAWYQNFNQNWDKIKQEYPDPFYKMWKYYLLSCAGAFRARDIQLWQVVLSKEGRPGGYESVR